MTCDLALFIEILIWSCLSAFWDRYSFTACKQGTAKWVRVNWFGISPEKQTKTMVSIAT